jgi:hypothetical protein
LQADGTIQLYSDWSGLKIFPQPATVQTNLIWSSPKRGEVSIELINTQGQLVHAEIEDKSAEEFVYKIPLQSLSNGLYHVRLICEGKQTQGVFVVSK